MTFFFCSLLGSISLYLSCYFMWNWVRFSSLHGKYSFAWKLKSIQELNKREWCFFFSDFFLSFFLFCRSIFREIHCAMYWKWWNFVENCYLMWFNFNPTKSNFDPDNSILCTLFIMTIRLEVDVLLIPWILSLIWNLNGNVHCWNMHAAGNVHVHNFWLLKTKKKKSKKQGEAS